MAEYKTSKQLGWEQPGNMGDAYRVIEQLDAQLGDVLDTSSKPLSPFTGRVRRNFSAPNMRNLGSRQLGMKMTPAAIPGGRLVPDQTYTSHVGYLEDPETRIKTPYGGGDAIRNRAPVSEYITARPDLQSAGQTQFAPQFNQNVKQPRQVNSIANQMAAQAKALRAGG